MRTKLGAAKKRKKKRILKAARGYRGGRSKLYRVAKQSVRRSRRFSWIGRRLKKRDFRRLWITRINAAARAREMNYSRFISGLKKADVQLNRKMLADIAINDPAAFDRLAVMSKEAFENSSSKKAKTPA